MDNKDLHIYNFKSEPKVSPFAPEWNYYIGECFIKDIDYKEFSLYLLKKEKQILSLPSTNKNNISNGDGYTGLGSNTTTAKHNQYNLFKSKNKNMIKIKKSILDIHNKFLELLNISKPKTLFAQCWVNIMRKGEQIKPHLHNTNKFSYLSGHICVKCNNTSTHYINPVNQINGPDVFSIKNEEGKVTLFQSNIPHYTDKVNHKEERITLAFDMDLNNSKNYIQII